MAAKEFESPTPIYHLLPGASQSKIDDVSSLPTRSPKAVQLKKEISLLSGVSLVVGNMVS